MTQLTTQLTAYFTMIPISPQEDLLSVHGLVNFKTILSGQVTFVCTHPTSTSSLHSPSVLPFGPYPRMQDL